MAMQQNSNGLTAEKSVSFQSLMRKLRPHMGPFVVMLVFTLILGQTTHFGFITNGTYGHDAGIFAYIGYAMANGRALYTQAWENKGPLLYLINMLGVMLNYWHGIYFFELAALLVSLLFAYKSALIITHENRWISLITAVFAMLLLVVTLEGGNLSEEYAIPFNCIVLYFITEFFYQDFKLRAYELIIVGMCFAAVFYLRANLCAFFAVMLIVITALLVWQKRWKTLLQAVLFVSVGIGLFSIPILGYLIVNQDLAKCVSDAYLNIMGGYKDLPKIDVITHVYSMLKDTISVGFLYVFVVFASGFLVFLRKGLIKSKPLLYILWISFIGLFVNLAVNSITGVYHPHYFMSFVPIIVAPAAWLLNSIYEGIEQKLHNRTTSIFLVFCAVLFLCFTGLTYLGNSVLKVSDYYMLVEQPDLPAEYVKKNTQPDDLVQVIGGDPTINYRTQRLTGSHHLYYAEGSFNDEAITRFADEIAADVMKTNPKLIMFVDVSMEDVFERSLTNEAPFKQFLQDRYEWQKPKQLKGYIVYTLK